MESYLDKIQKSDMVERALYLVSLAIVIFFMIHSQIYLTTRDVILVLYIHSSLLIIFLKYLQQKTTKVQLTILCLSIILTIYSAAYIFLNIEHLQLRRWFNTPHDLLVGVILIALVFYAGILCYGKFVPIMVMIVMIYPFFGQHLPEPFTTHAYSIPKAISNLAIGLDRGIFSSPTQTMIDYVFLFIVFGSILGATGVSDFFYELGKLLVGKLISGPALIATLNSALVGSIVGSALSNITITGSYTIPAMKKAGYTPEQAGAIEVAASNGGQILPPIMGIIAFAMAGFSGVPYVQIVKMAVIPALLYYLCVAIYAHLCALKSPTLRNRQTEKIHVDMNIIRYKAPSFVVPFILIIYLLYKGYSVNYVAFWAIVSVIIVSMLVPKSYRPKIHDFLNGFVDGGVSGAQIGAIAAVVGIMLTTFTGSGLGIKLSIGIGKWSGGNLFFALLIIWVISVILGMIGVAVVSYFTCAAFAVPVLIDLGLMYETAHFFIVFPTSFALMTPPVALSAIVAARMAEGDYMQTSIESVKIALAAFLLPFLFVYSPALLLQISPLTTEFWIDISLISIALIAFQVSNVGYFISNLSLVDRALALLGGVALIAYIAWRLPYFALTGIVLIGVVIFSQFKSKKIFREIIEKH